MGCLVSCALSGFLVLLYFIFSLAALIFTLVGIATAREHSNFREDRKLPSENVCIQSHVICCLRRILLLNRKRGQPISALVTVLFFSEAGLDTLKT